MADADTTRVLNILHPRLRDLILERGFKRLTEPQIKAFPYILRGENVLIVAPTGSGKTEAALIPILNRMIENPSNPIQLLYVTPLRALNRDLISRILWWASKLGFRVAIRHGDTAIRDRRVQRLMPPDILITTPETFSILMNAKVFRRHLANVRYIIIDEIHELIASKRGAQLSINLERLAEEVGRIQRIGLSATIGSPEEVLKFLVGTNGDGVIINVDITKKIDIDIEYPKACEKDVEKASELYTFPDVIARIRRINELVKRHRSTLIFTNTRPMAEVLGSRLFLYDNTIPIQVHHGSLGREIRLRIEDMLKRGLIKAVVCTSSLELGIDIGDIDLVIQYNSPRQVSKIIQRVGRSGHWIERVSKGVVIVQEPDDALEAIAIRDYVYKGFIEPARVINKPYDVLLHELAGLIIVDNSISLEDLYKMLKRSYVYSNLKLDELKNVVMFASSLQRKYIKFIEDQDLIVKPRNGRELYEYYYSILSMIPEVRQYVVVNEETNELVGVLDEEFVTGYGMPGVKFVMGGKPWIIVQVFKDKVYVKPTDDYFGAIPNWVGEEIPVPYEVARKVGEYKRLFIEEIKRHNDFDRAVDKLASVLNISKDLLKRIYRSIYDALSSNTPIPTDRDIVIEELKDDRIIIHIHAGTLINRTLAGCISCIISDSIGCPIRCSSDQYRIFIWGSGISITDILNTLKNISEKEFTQYLRKTIEASRIFKWRLIHVARRMGIISKEETLDRDIADILVRNLKGTPAYDEAFRECIFKDYDLDGSLKILKMIRDGKFRIYTVKGPTPYTLEYLKLHETRFKEIYLDRVKMIQILSTKAKLLNTIRTFACLNCKNVVWEARIIDLNDEVKCPECGSRLIGLTRRLPHEVEEVLELSKYKSDQTKKNPIYRELKRTAELISKYGKVAAFVLASNLSISDVKKILSYESRINNKLISLIIEFEKKSFLKRRHSQL